MVTAAQASNWAKIKVSGKSFLEKSVPVNTKSIQANLGMAKSPDKKKQFRKG